MMPTGFRFNPTDEELIQILQQKASGQEMPLHFNFIVERNVYDLEPQDLQWDHTLALSENERYCYCTRESDSREVLGKGWWKATSHVKRICANDGTVIGYKRPLTFYRFKDTQTKRSNAIKTNWIMHEYCLESHKTEWRLCKIKYKGKPSVQEELEDVRNGYKLRNDFEAGSSSMIMGNQQPVDFAAKEEQLLPVEQQQKQHQQTTSYDPFPMQIGNTNYYFGDHDQLQQADSPEQIISPNLWSWQNQNL